MTLTFTDPGEQQRWYAVDDGVMGGKSHSRFRVEADTGCFYGEVSLENGGGFASVRREPDHIESLLTQGKGISLRVRGDGRTYQLRLKSTSLDEASAYRVTFTPANGEWETWDFSWHSFEAVRRGTLLTSAPPLDPHTIHQLGFLIADRTAGSFALYVFRLTELS